MNPDQEVACRGDATETIFRLHLFGNGEREQAFRWMDAAQAETPVIYGDRSWLIFKFFTVPNRVDFYLREVHPVPPQGAEMSDPVVNRSLAVFLLGTPNLRAVKVTYEGFDENKKPIGNLTLFKTFEKDLAVGDLVIVPTSTRVGFTAVQVAELDAEPDYESTKEVGWIVGKFDASGYGAIVQREQQIIDAVKAADKRARQEELRKRLLGNVDPNTLPVIDLAAIEAPKPAQAGPNPPQADEAD